ncbi:MAG: ABC transporter permease [Acetobacteraceae bacterium]|nr:ABC transporter permease [Acetobacteraceae bacterium]
MNLAVTSAAHSTPLDLRTDRSHASRHQLAFMDVRQGLRLLPLAWMLGWLDIRQRYRGSVLGPFWLTISNGVMVGALGFLYSRLFNTDIHDYLPFLALSQVLWGFIAGTVGESCTAFTDAESVIRSIRMPFSLFPMRLLIRNGLVLAHTIVVIIVVDCVYPVWPGWNALLSVPALLLWCLDSLAVTLLLGGFCARFRDVQPIVNSLMQIAFFITPVLWKPEQLGSAAGNLLIDPFFDLLAIVREPLLGGVPSLATWLCAIAYSLLLCTASWAFFVRARGRIAFWI